MVEFSLKKQERLSSRKAIEGLFADGKSFLIFPLKIVWKVVDADFSYPAQAAFTVSKRNFKRAVKRNLLKRRMRESYRVSKHILYDPLQKRDKQVIFMVIFVGKEVIDSARILKSIKRVLCRLVEEVNRLDEVK